MHFYANCSFFARNSDAAIDAVAKNGKFLTLRWWSALHSVSDSTFENDLQYYFMKWFTKTFEELGLRAQI